MGHRSVVVNNYIEEDNAPGPSIPEIVLPETVRADAAVFTSIRSPKGVGYRITAAPPGLHPDERADITRRSPSHESMCVADEQALGLSVYRLAGGRVCVGLHGHAGKEHTARGGWRVYTHMAVIPMDIYMGLGGDPVALHAALVGHVGEQGPLLTESAGLPPVELSCPSWSDKLHTLQSVASAEIEQWLWPVVHILLQGGELVLVGAAHPYELLRWALFCLPLEMRSGMECSVGLKYAPSRKLRLVLMDNDDPMLPRLTAGRDLALWRQQDQAKVAAGPFGPWIELMRDLWQRQAYEQIYDLSTHRFADAEAGLLDSLAEQVRDEVMPDDASE